MRGPHLDHFDKIFGLFYMRDENDNSEGGDLVLYKWKNSYNNFKKKNIIFTEKWEKTLLHSEPVKTLKYQKYFYFSSKFNQLSSWCFTKK